MRDNSSNVLDFSERDLDAALTNMRQIAPESPLTHSNTLSERYGVPVYLKEEHRAPIGSYKWRGAFQAISSLSDEEKARGVVCASAGNHAQGVALACNKLGVHCTIVMPRTVPVTKREKTEQIGGEYVTILLEGDVFDQAYASAKGLEEERSMSFIHPFDDRDIILGQSTVGLEVMSQMNRIHQKCSYILAPIGGGGLISGVQIAVSSIGKDTKVIGIEPEAAASMTEALKIGKTASVEVMRTIADGAKVGKVGEFGFQVCTENNIEVLQSPEGRLSTTILEMYKDWQILEGAGALGVDGLKSLDESVFNEVRQNKGAIVVILSGGNMDTDAYQRIKEKSLKYEGLKREYLIQFPERPGAGGEIMTALGKFCDISSFHYDQNSSRSENPVSIAIQVEDPATFEDIEKEMFDLGFAFQDITHMSGGRAHVLRK